MIAEYVPLRGSWRLGVSQTNQNRGIDMLRVKVAVVGGPKDVVGGGGL